MSKSTPTITAGSSANPTPALTTAAQSQVQNKMQTLKAQPANQATAQSAPKAQPNIQSQDNALEKIFEQNRELIAFLLKKLKKLLETDEEANEKFEKSHSGKLTIIILVVASDPNKDPEKCWEQLKGLILGKKHLAAEADQQAEANQQTEASPDPNAETNAEANPASEQPEANAQGEAPKPQPTAQNDNFKDFYKELGVGRDASDREIKMAFSKKAMEHHPDKGGNEENFKKVAGAYEVLNDKDRRADYNQQYDARQEAQAGSSASSGPSPSPSAQP